MDDSRQRTLKMAARYLGIRGEPPSLLLEAYEEMLAVARPRHVLRRGAVKIVEGKDASHIPLLVFEGLPPVPSRDICRLLDGCAEGYALLLTLGMELELRMRQLMVTAPGLATAVGACGSAYVDVSIDQVLEEERKRQGVRLTRRFSPGYGDLPLSMQPGLLRLLDAKRLGVHLTEGLLMLPEKSVTALMGIAGAAGEDGERKAGGNCESCEKEDCLYRAEKAEDGDERYE